MTFNIQIKWEQIPTEITSELKDILRIEGTRLAYSSMMDKGNTSGGPISYYDGTHVYKGWWSCVTRLTSCDTLSKEYTYKEDSLKIGG